MSKCEEPPFFCFVSLCADRLQKKQTPKMLVGVVDFPRRSLLVCFPFPFDYLCVVAASNKIDEMREKQLKRGNEEKDNDGGE